MPALEPVRIFGGRAKTTASLFDARHRQAMGDQDIARGHLDLSVFLDREIERRLDAYRRVRQTERSPCTNRQLHRPAIRRKDDRVRRQRQADAFAANGQVQAVGADMMSEVDFRRPIIGQRRASLDKVTRKVPAERAIRRRQHELARAKGEAGMVAGRECGRI